MTDRADPLERLRAANPVNVERLAQATESTRARVLFEEITAMQTVQSAEPETVRTAPRPGRRYRRRLVSLAAVASLSFGGVAAYALVTRDATTTHSVGCYQQADLQADTVVVAGDGRGPIQACTEAWNRGQLGPTPVPALQGCILESGVAGVFPSAAGENVCATLGLATLSAGSPSAGDRKFLAFKDSVVARFSDGSCIDQARGTSIVHEELDRAGLVGWTIGIGGGIEGEGFSAQRPCAGLALEQAQRRVVLVPQPPPS